MKGEWCTIDHTRFCQESEGCSNCEIATREQVIWQGRHVCGFEEYQIERTPRGYSLIAFDAELARHWIRYEVGA